jgi:hypothetical protein
MKNVHILKTDEPSRLHLGNSGLVLCDLVFNPITINSQHVYITVDDTIKIGDREIIDNECRKLKFTKETRIGKKVILSTDPKLIDSGVQAIPEDFLKWFVKNPSCEFVDVNDWMDINGNIAFGGNIRYQISCSTYKEIILPQEEPKQEFTTVNGSSGCTITVTDEKGKPLTYWGGLKEPKQETTMKETIEEAARGFDKSKCKHFRREHTKEEVYDSFEEGFTAGAKSDAAREMWHKKFKHESINALKAIENLCDSQNPTHEDIWRIAYGVINDLTGKE